MCIQHTDTDKKTYMVFLSMGFIPLCNTSLFMRNTTFTEIYVTSVVWVMWLAKYLWNALTVSYQLRSASTPYTVSFIVLCLMLANQSPCGPCGCAAADPAAGASNGLKSLWGCCKQITPLSVCAAGQKNNSIKKVKWYNRQLLLQIPQHF